MYIYMCVCVCAYMHVVVCACVRLLTYISLFVLPNYDSVKSHHIALMFLLQRTNAQQYVERDVGAVQ